MKRTGKNLLVLLIVLSLSLAGMAVSAAEVTFTPGTYEGIGKGYMNDIPVTVTVSENKIERIEFGTHQESLGISDPAFEKLPVMIMESNSVAHDTLSGCTFSSQGIMEAVKVALLAAGADEAIIMQAPEAKEGKVSEHETYEADIIVIGAGGAGSTAAYEALSAGNKVILFDKASSAGGNTIAAGSALNASDQKRQHNQTMTESEIHAIEAILAVEPANDMMATWQENVAKDIETYKANGDTYLYDSPDLHKLQTYIGGDFVANPQLVDRFAEEAPHSVDFLEELGTIWKEEVTAAIGATWSRSHMPEPEPWGTKGAPFVMPQITKVKELGGEIILEHRVEHLVVEDGRVVGVTGTTLAGDTFEAKAGKAVLIATGGFGANVEMREKYNTFWPSLDANVKTTNVPSATGDGIEMALEVGANLVGMEWIQMLTNADKTDYSASINNIIYINAEGERYVKEDGRRDEIASATLAQTGSYCYWVTDSQEIDDRLGGITYAGFVVDDLIDGELMFKADTVEALADQLGVDPTILQATLDKYNEAVETGEDEFGRQVFGVKLEKGPFHANYVTAKVHHTMGGIEIDVDTHVINTNGEIIEGLFAAGEVTGGVHGANRLGGNAIADVISFGRVAGREMSK